MNKILYIFIIILFIFFNVNSYAQDILLEDYCANYTDHVPDADVDYQGGYDVRGDAVVPAELDSSSTLEVPDEITMYLTLDQLNAIDFPLADTIDPVLSAGRVTINTRDDVITFNGQSIDRNNLDVLCLKPE